MIRKINIWQFILFLIALIILFRFNELVQSYYFLILFVKSSVTQNNFFTNHLSFDVIDQILSPVIIILLSVIAIIKRNVWRLLKKRITLSYCAIAVFITIFIFAPIIAPYNPNLQLNLSVSKNLPPLSSKILVEINNPIPSITNTTRYDELRMELTRDVVDDNYFLADSVNYGQETLAYQKNKKVNISSDLKHIKLDTAIFLCGTDEFGRDIFSRLIYATRLSLLIGISAVVITFILGLTLGFISGYFSKSFDLLLNRFTEMLLAIPTIFLVILFLASFGNSLTVVIILLGFAGWMSLFKIVRGEVISLKNKNFIISSKLLGIKNWNLLTKEFIPMIIPSVVVNLVFQFANVIIAESVLSFLGLTGNHLYPTWGAMIHEGQFYLKQAWWISFFPSFLLVITLIAIYNLGREIESKINPMLNNK